MSFLRVSLVSLLLAGPATAQELVSFPTDDGGVVYADVYGCGDHGVVLAHGGRFNKQSWAIQAQTLADAGFRVVAIDFRGRGQSRGGPQASSADDVRFDVLAAIQFLHEAGTKTVSVIGASFGGWAAAQAAVESPEGQIDRIVLLAASPIDEPEKMTGRKLFITTRDDFSGDGILRLPGIRDQFERAPDPKQLLILDGSAHAQHIFETDQGARLMAEILRFLSDP
jgi:pimeloyl-ACP methyl ester carboxylesterase